MADKLNADKLKDIQKIVEDVDKIIVENQYKVVDVLNALSMFSVSIAVRLNLNKELYLNDLSIMFDERKSLNELQNKQENNHE